MRYIMAFTVGIVFKSLGKDPFAFFSIRTGKQHAFSSNCN